MAETPTAFRLTLNPPTVLHDTAPLSPPAPAAPSVGEPTSHDDAQFIKMAMIGQSSLDMVFALLEQKAEIATALGIDPVESSHNDILAQCAALRSSLEEARKDSERLTTLRAAIEALPRLDLFYNYADSEITEQPDGQFVDRAIVLALFPPRAPSPRDEP